MSKEHEGTPTERRLRAGMLSRDEARRVRDSALALLEQRGVRVAGARAHDVLERAGATVDRATHVVRIPSPVVDRALALLPPRVVLAGRLPERDVPLDGGRCVLATGGPAPEVLDLDGQRRAGAAGDLAAACRLADALPEIAVLARPPLPATDVPERGRVLRELAICLANTTKHVQLTTVKTVAEARAVVAIAEALAGSRQALRERPRLSLAVPAGAEPDESSLDAMLVAAAAGVPVGFSLAVAGPAQAASTAAAPAAPAAAQAAPTWEKAPPMAFPPRDLAARPAVLYAAVLAACALVQLAAPGAPFVAPLPMRPVTGVKGGDAASSTAGYLFAMAYNDVSDSCRLPLAAAAPAPPSVSPGWRASVESSFATLAAALGGADVVTGAGLLDGGAAFSAQQLVLDCESQSVSARIAQGIEVDEETIALETIAKVGIGGNALGQRHTRAHMKDVWRPRLFDRSSYEAWAREGRKGSEHEAAELAARLPTAHEVPPLEAAKVATVERIIATAGL